MEIFLDTASIEEIRDAAKLGIVSGVTTNPSLMMRAGRGDYQKVTREICYIVQNCISAEVTSTSVEDMIAEAREIATWSPHVVVKIPLTEQGLQALKTVRDCEVDLDRLCQGCEYLGRCDTPLEEAKDLASTWGIRVNATLVFSPNQALFAALGGAAFVSPFVGRLDDAGHDGMQVVRDIVDILDFYGYDTQVIAASIRHPLHITQAALAGAHIATVPYKVLMQAIRHPLTDVGVERFLADWAQIKKQSQ
ncbi:MAG: transaldolase family protein [Chloroflexi bacterium]|nr:transaldolase family protein [Chloroflexota bacterium]